MRDPAGHHIGGAGGPVPLYGEERQVNVLPVAERAAGRHDLGQDGGEFGRQRPPATVWVLRLAFMPGPTFVPGLSLMPGLAAGLAGLVPAGRALVAVLGHWIPPRGRG